jgi:preprotein translocase subunit SecD
MYNRAMKSITALAALALSCSGSSESKPAPTVPTAPTPAAEPVVEQPSTLVLTAVPKSGTLNAAAKAAAVERIGARLADLGLADESFSVSAVDAGIAVELRGLDDDKISDVRRVLVKPGTISLHLVESDAAAMKKIAEAVKQGGGPVTAETESWKAPGGKQRTDTFLKAPGREALEKALAGRDVPEDRLVGVERVLSAGSEHWRSFWLEKQPILDAGDIESAEAEANQAGVPMIRIKLKEEASRRFAEVTGKNLGRKIAIVMDGVVRTAPVVQAKITGGELVLSTGGASPQEVKTDVDDILRGIRLGALPALKIATEEKR